MAFRTVTTGETTKTIYIGDDPKKEQVPSWEGFLVEVKEVTTEPKGKGKKPQEFTFLLAVEKDEAGADLVSVLSCGQLTYKVCEGERGERKLKDSIRGRKVRLTFLGYEKVQGYPNALKQVKVEVDDEARLTRYELPPI